MEWPPAGTARVGRQGVCAHGVYGLGAARYTDQLWSMMERGVFMAVGFHRQILLVMPRHGIAAAFTGRKQWAFAPWMDLLDRAAKTPSAVSTSVASPAGTAAAR